MNKGCFALACSTRLRKSSLYSTVTVLSTQTNWTFLLLWNRWHCRNVFFPNCHGNSKECNSTNQLFQWGCPTLLHKLTSARDSVNVIQPYFLPFAIWLLRSREKRFILSFLRPQLATCNSTTPSKCTLDSKKQTGHLHALKIGCMDAHLHAINPALDCVCGYVFFADCELQRCLHWSNWRSLQLWWLTLETSNVIFYQHANYMQTGSLPYLVVVCLQCLIWNITGSRAEGQLLQSLSVTLWYRAHWGLIQSWSDLGFYRR